MVEFFPSVGHLTPCPHPAAWSLSPFSHISDLQVIPPEDDGPAERSRFQDCILFFSSNRQSPRRLPPLTPKLSFLTSRHRIISLILCNRRLCGLTMSPSLPFFPLPSVAWCRVFVSLSLPLLILGSGSPPAVLSIFLILTIAPSSCSFRVPPHPHRSPCAVLNKLRLATVFSRRFSFPSSLPRYSALPHDWPRFPLTCPKCDLVISCG